MTKKDYILIARAILAVRQRTTDKTELRTISAVVDSLCGELARDNSRFNHTVFIQACCKTEVSK
jgi:hypothetical protein